ncbi:MAG: hypothetical protein JXR76_10515 [Deltaproteobacteria bacterium]|nr:hypothetical protein [Deltaproteobacteria bacterium]
MKKITCLVFGCCCMVLGGIVGCGLKERSSSEKGKSSTSNAPRGQVITEDENIVIRPKAEVDQEEKGLAACPSHVARAVADAYLKSAPISAEKLKLEISKDSSLVTYVDAHKGLFSENGPAVECARHLGQRVVALGESAFSTSEEMHKTMVHKWGGAAPGTAADAADNVQSRGASMYVLGQELLWLAEVLPGVAAGNLAQFNEGNSPMRRQLQNAISEASSSQTSSINPNATHIDELLDITSTQYRPDLSGFIVMLAGTLQPMPDAEPASK